MTPTPLDFPISTDLLVSRFDGAELVIVDEDARLIGVWNGSLTINIYDFHLSEVGTGPHSISDPDDGQPVPQDEVEAHIEDLLAEYRDSGDNGE